MSHDLTGELEEHKDHHYNGNQMNPLPHQKAFRLFPPRFRAIFFPADFIICWAAVIYKARVAESWPWLPLLMVTIFILGTLALDVILSSRFEEHLAPAVYGFLLGAGINAVIQNLLNRFQGINWTFQSPILSSLGTLLLGFLGAVIFITHGEHIKKHIPCDLFLNTGTQIKGKAHSFVVILWVIAAAAALGLCINLMMTLKIFSGMQTDNPLRKPLWFSGGAVILVFLTAILARKNAAAVLTALIPGLISGLIAASLFRDMLEWVYLKYPEFPLSSDILEVLLILNFCYLGTAWLNKSLFSSHQKREEETS
ncbi:MAG: hypothetical protein WBC70_16560 [Candidatus Aminicenantales bacterium]